MDCFWCRQLDTLSTTPDSASIYRHIETGLYVTMERIEHAPKLSVTGQPRMYANLWGTTNQTYAPLNAFTRVTVLP